MNHPDTDPIDATPKWSQVLPLLIMGLEHGSEEGKRVARKELERMARLADAFVAQAKGSTK